MWAHIQSLTQMHCKLWIQVLEVLKAKVSRPEKSTIGDLDFDHALISQYLRLPRLLIPKIDVGSILFVMAASMNRFRPPIENLSTRRVILGERPIVQTTITFMGEYNYERPHTNDGILDIEGWCPTKRIVTKHLR